VTGAATADMAVGGVPERAAWPRGLTEQEAATRRSQGQGNPSAPPTGRTYGQIIRENVFTFVNNAIFLLGLALVLVGRPVDALISVGIILANVAVSVVQEIRAKRMLDRISLLTRPMAQVVRDGQPRTAAPEELVLGDTLAIGPGDQVLLDGPVVQGHMQVDESQLTGESDLIAKGAGDTLYSGSFVVSGSGYYTVGKVGAESLANQIAAGAKAYRRVLTPLQREVNLAIRAILFIVAYLEILIIANGLIKAIPLPEGVQQATVIVGLVPNGLFVAIAVAYALGAVRIARHGALVQQSNAVESLSNVDVLCLDKTGTLTANRLQVAGLHPLELDEASLRAALGTLTASMAAHNKTGEALAAAFPGEPVPLQAEVPFSSARKWSAAAWASGLYALGAPEMLRPYLGEAGREGSPAWDAMAGQMAAWTGQGLRVLLLAQHPDPARLADEGDASRLPDNMVAAGLVALSDELRPEAAETLASFIRNGVRPKIISGDSPDTVAALARQAGLVDVVLVTGPALERMTEAEFEQAAVRGTIFGRITPRQKEHLVDALKRRGHYVAMIGDGVNDVLSLKKANLGIAMQSGTQATRSVADLVLLGDSFACLAPAVAEGQRIVNGMQDILKLFLTRIATMGLVILSALVIGVFPVNLRHASLLTLLVVGIPTILLAVWARPGRRKFDPGLARRLAHFVLPAMLVSSLLGLVVFYAPLLYRLNALPADLRAPGTEAYRLAVATGQTSLTAFLVAVGLLLILFVEPPARWWVGADAYSGDHRPAYLAAALAVVFIIVMSVPALAASFELQPLGLLDVVLILGLTLVWLGAVRWMWRGRALQRYFDLGSGSP
jgi:cation-transporting P-type ATPase E